MTCEGENYGALNEEKTKVDIVLIVIGIIAGLLLYISIEFNMKEWVIYLSAITLVAIITWIGPFYRTFKKNGDKYIEIKDMFLFFTHGIYGVILSYAAYLIIMTDRYDLYYSYWVVGIAVVYIVLFSQISGLIKSWKKSKKDKAEEGEVEWVGFFSVLFGALLAVVLFIVQTSMLWDDVVVPKQVKNLEHLYVPKSFSVEIRYPKKLKGRTAPYRLYESVGQLRDDRMISRLIEEIRGQRVENIRNTETFNYDKLKMKNKPYYRLKPNYEEAIKDDYSLDAGTFWRMEIYTNGYVVLSEWTPKGEPYFEHYFVKVSQGIVDRIINRVYEIKKDDSHHKYN